MQSYISQALIVVALVSGIPLLISTAIGALVALLQSAFQVQEQSLGYIIKLISLGTTIFLCSNWFSAKLITFTAEALQSIATLGRIM